MDRTLALQDFQNKSAEAIMAAKDKMDVLFQTHEDELCEQIICGFCKICNAVVEKQKNIKLNPIRYFQVSLLKTYIPLGQIVYLLSAYNQNYFLDKENENIEITTDCINIPLSGLRKILYEKVDEYRGGVLYSDANRELVNIVDSINRQFATKMRLHLRDFGELEQVKFIEKNNPYFVKWGGHWEESATVFVGDRRKKSQELFVVLNKNNDIEKLDTKYVYGIWDKVVFNEFLVSKKALIYNSFRYAVFNQCQVDTCTFFGSDFKNAKIKDSVFVSCTLRNCNFKQTVLENVSFLGCDLSQSDFQDSEHQNLTFTQSFMQDTLFSREEVAFLHLDATQFQQIKVQSEE